MKWNTTPTPRQGATRIREAFAWFPVKCRNDKMVWLEKYLVTEEYCIGYTDEWWIAIGCTAIEGKK